MSITINLLPLSTVIEHEEVVSSRVKMVKYALMMEKVVRRPIIVHEDKKFVVDGHHRLQALRELGVKYVPVVYANYDRDIKDIKGWSIILNVRNLKGREVIRQVQDFEQSIKRGSNKMIIKLKDSLYEVSIDALDSYRTITEINLDIFKVRNYTKRVTELSRDLRQDFVIVLPPLSKYSIFKIVQKGLVLPPRSTYHITYLKKININFSLKKLK